MTPSKSQTAADRRRLALPEGTAVRIVESKHEWLEPGMTGVIHWAGMTNHFPSFHSEGWPNNGVSVQLLPGRDRVEKL